MIRPSAGPARRRPPRELRDHHRARLRVPGLGRRHLHVREQPLVERHDEAQARVVEIEAPDDGRVRPLEDPDHPPFHAVGLLALDAQHHAIAVQRLLQVGGGHVDIGLRIAAAGVGRDEPEPARVRLQAADHEVHAVGQAEAVAPNLDQVATLDEQLEVPPYRGTVLTRDAQQLQQLFGRGGVVHAVAELSEQLFA